MTDLREEMARALYARHKYIHDWDSCKNACRKRAFLDEADALLPIIARVRAEERERCVRVAEEKDALGYVHHSRDDVVAAIRALGDE